MYQCFARNQYGTAVTAKSALKKAGKDCYSVSVSVSVVDSLASTHRGCRGHIPRIFRLGGRQREYPPILSRIFGYTRPVLVALRSLSLKPISFGYKTPQIRFSQAGGQLAHKAHPPNLELALTPLSRFIYKSLFTEKR